MWSLLSEYVRKGGIFMLYTMREGHDGVQFYPIRDDNVYIYFSP